MATPVTATVNSLVPAEDKVVKASQPPRATRSAIFFRGRGQELPDDLNDDAIYQQIEQWAGAHTRFKDVPADVDPRELLQYADVGRQLSPHQAEIAEYLRSKQSGQQQPQPTQQPAATQQAAQPQRPAGPSDDDVRLAMSRCKKDEHGVWQPSHAFDADLAKMLNDRAQRASMSMEQFGTDPASFLKPHFESMIEQYIKEKLDPRFAAFDPVVQWAQQAQAAQVQQAVFGPRDAEYVVRDENTGEIASFTPKGEALNKFIVQAQQQFPNWPEQERLEWAALQADRAVPNAANQGGKGKLPFQGNQQGAGQGTNGKSANGQQNGAAGGASADRPAKTTARRRSFVDAGRQRGEDGKFLPVDRSATIANSAKRREPQGRGQTLEELYFAAKNGGE